MNGEKRLLLLFLYVMMSTFGTAKALSNDPAKVLMDRNTKPLTNTYSSALIEQQIKALETTICLTLNAQVEKRIKGLVTRGRKGMEHFLGRSTQYFPTIEKKIKEVGVPDELKYLTVVESGLKPKVKSGKGAAGLWQLMPGTGGDYGLVINDQVDERYDLNKSTEAALFFLKDLHQKFGDWTLAIAAYNCGPVRVKQAIARRKSKDFWKIKALLPKQTQAYVEKFTAIAYLMNYYHFYNLRPRYPDYNLQMTQTIKVYSRKSFNQIAKETGIPVPLIKTLNPSYLTQIIPAKQAGSNLILPLLGIKSDFLPEGMQLLGQR